METQFIRNAIESRFKEIAEKEFLEAEKRIHEKMSEVTSGIVLHLMEHVSCSYLGKDLILRVELPSIKK